MIPQSRELEDIRKSRVCQFGDVFRTIREALHLLNARPSGFRSTRFFGDKKLAWFPKVAVLRNESLVPPDRIRWINTISADGSEVIQQFAPRGNPRNNNEKFFDVTIERAIFAKLPRMKGYKRGYTFLGVFKKLTEQDGERKAIYTRLSEELKMEDWDYNNYK